MPPEVEEGLSRSSGLFWSASESTSTPGTLLGFEAAMMENESALEYREHCLRSLCPARPSVPKRTAPPSRTRPIGDPVGLSFYVARRRIGDALDDSLIDLAGAASARLPKQALRELLAAVSVRGATRRHLLDAERFVECLAALPAREQLETIALYRETARADTLRTELLAALEWPALLQLTAPLRRQILRYLIGPRPGALAHPDHELDLRAFWARRAAETRQFLETQGGDDEGAVLGHLVQPIRPIHLLRTPADLDLVVLVFGDPRSSRSLSFGRYYTLDAAGRAEASVVCPDPRIASEWRDRHVLTSRTYECRSALLTRLEELELLRWLEDGHAIAPNERHRPATLPLAIFTNTRRLGETIEPAIRVFASVRGPLVFTRTLLFRGRPQRNRRNKARTPSAE